MSNILQDALDFVNSLTEEQIQKALEEIPEETGKKEGYEVFEGFEMSPEAKRLHAAFKIWGHEADEKTKEATQATGVAVEELSDAEKFEIHKRVETFNTIQTAFWTMLREEILSKRGEEFASIGIRKGGIVVFNQKITGHHSNIPPRSLLAGLLGLGG